MNQSRLLGMALLYVLAVSWGLAHAELRQDARGPEVSDTATRPFAVVELFTSEG
jgi:hypothetical protein